MIACKLLKKNQEIIPIDKFKDSVNDLPCYGVSIQAGYDKSGLLINGVREEVFCKNIPLNFLSLNINLFNSKKLNCDDYYNIAEILGRINQFKEIILSSGSLTRDVLSNLKKKIYEIYGEMAPKVMVASQEKIPSDLQRDNEQIIIFPAAKSERMDIHNVVSMVNDGKVVLLDWPNNNNQRISKVIERTNNDDGVLILSVKPKTTRGIIQKSAN